MTLQYSVRVDEDLVLAEVGAILGDVRLPVVHLAHVGVEGAALREGLAARLAEQAPRRLQPSNRNPDFTSALWIRTDYIRIWIRIQLFRSFRIRILSSPNRNLFGFGSESQCDLRNTIQKSNTKFFSFLESVYPLQLY